MNNLEIKVLFAATNDGDERAIGRGLTMREAVVGGGITTEAHGVLHRRVSCRALHASYRKVHEQREMHHRCVGNSKSEARNPKQIPGYKCQA